MIDPYADDYEEDRDVTIFPGDLVVPVAGKRRTFFVYTRTNPKNSSVLTGERAQITLDQVGLVVSSMNFTFTHVYVLFPQGMGWAFEERVKKIE